MPHYKLVPSGRSDAQVDEIVLSRDEFGEVKHSLSVHEVRSIPEEMLERAHSAAGDIGVSVVEAEPPDSESEEGAADDTQGGSGNQPAQQGSDVAPPGTSISSGSGGTTPGGLSTPSSPSTSS
jgi:hypothetical protein